MSSETQLTPAEIKKKYEEAKKNLIEARRMFAEASSLMHKKRRRKKEVIRKANDMDDSHLREKSSTWQQLFKDRVAAFSAFDADLNLTFANAWENKITAFEDLASDETMRDDIEDKTQTLNEKMDALLGLTTDLEYFVKRAFPNDERKLMEFGFDRLRKQVPNYVGYLCLNVLTQVLLLFDYASELTAAGMPPALSTQLEDGVDALADAESKQEYVKRLRIRKTTERVKLFNELWGIHIIVRDAAVSVFKTDPTTAKMFE